MKQRAISSQRAPLYVTCGQVLFGSIFAVMGTFITLQIGRPFFSDWNRTGRLPYNAFATLIPLLFVVVGVVVIVAAARPRKRARLNAAPSATPDDISGVLELKPSQSGLAQFIVITVFAACWNGFVGFAASAAWSQGTLISFFLLPFIAVGILLLGLVFFSLLKMFNPHPQLRLSPGAIVLGGKADLEFTMFGSANRIESLRITLEGIEEAKYQQGTRTVTATNVFERITLYETVNPMEIRAGATVVQLPEFTMHSFQSPRNKIIWHIKVAGVIRRWPDIDETFPITVLPLPIPIPQG